MVRRYAFRSRPGGLSRRHPAFWIASWGGVGMVRHGSGTWGSLAALPFAWPILEVWGPVGLGIAALAVYAAGVWASAVVERLGEKDSSFIVIDEVAGQWLTLTAAALDPWLFLLGFGLFRLYDIWKPFPADWVDQRMGGGLGVMTDDMIAGLYGALSLWGLRWLIGW
ncbi:MAG TPA: phosphatidylglycerophosphatase A [Alphaproteobacteria bacterium]|nr:phosphatidylglycerophosphatase A [Alphaproteobacteria bacterium]